jgi:hypothetical protein
MRVWAVCDKENILLISYSSPAKSGLLNTIHDKVACGSLVFSINVSFKQCMSMSQMSDHIMNPVF